MWNSSKCFLEWIELLALFFPTSGFGLIPFGFLEVLVYNLHNSLLDYSRYLWRLVADTQRQGSTAVNWWSQSGCCGMWLSSSLQIVVHGPWSNDLPQFVYCHMCDLFSSSFYFRIASFWLLCIEYGTLKALD